MTEHDRGWDDDPFAPDPPTGGMHPPQITHLVMGIACLCFVGVWAALSSDLADADDLRWLLPVPWVLAGLGGLLASTLGRRSGSR